MASAFGSIDDLGEGYGFRKVRRELGPGGLCHVESTTPRRFSNVGDDDLVVLVVGGKDGYVGRDGQLVDPERDLERRREFGGSG